MRRDAYGLDQQGLPDRWPAYVRDSHSLGT